MTIPEIIARLEALHKLKIDMKGSRSLYIMPGDVQDIIDDLKSSEQDWTDSVVSTDGVIICPHCKVVVDRVDGDWPSHGAQEMECPRCVGFFVVRTYGPWNYETRKA